MKILRRLYRPYVLARYALFRRSNRNNTQKHDIPDEYNMISFFNAVSPVWLETVLVVILSDFIPLEVGMRLKIIAALFIVNILVSRLIIIRLLKKENYVERQINQADANAYKPSRYDSFFFSMAVLSGYAIVPMLPVVIYFGFFR